MDALPVAMHLNRMGKNAEKRTAPLHFIRKWRKHRGYTLEAAAAEIDSTHATLSRIERGVHPYNQAILERLAWLYQCTPGDLLSTDPVKRDTAKAA